jgi:hypothetical protein
MGLVFNNKINKERLAAFYKEFIYIFDHLENMEDIDYIYMIRICHNLTDFMVKNNIIEKYGNKNYKIVESGEII